MDSVIRRVFLQAIEADLRFAEEVDEAAEILGMIGVRELPGKAAWESWCRYWFAEYRCPRDSDWCDGYVCRDNGITCPRAEKEESR